MYKLSTVDFCIYFQFKSFYSCLKFKKFEMCQIFLSKFVDFCPDFKEYFKKLFSQKMLGIVSRKSIDFRDTIPGNKLISGYCYSDINLFQGNNTQTFSKKTIFVNLKYPEIKRFPGIVPRKLLRKKPNFVNISVKRKIFSKIFLYVNPGTRYY